MVAGRDGRAWRTLAELSSIGMTMVVATLIGVAGGYYLDAWLGTKPWLLIVGFLFGAAAGFRGLFRALRAVERGQKQDEG
jgi:ATP synthase protein I